MKPNSSFIYIGLGIIVLIGLFFIFKPKNSTEVPMPSSTTTTLPSPQITPEVKTFNITVKNRRVVSGPETISVNEGDQVEINITADEDNELHLHGYDLKVDLKKDKLAKLTFKTNLTGRFIYELEKTSTDIGSLEVQPK